MSYLNVGEIRKDFPILERDVKSRKIIYFDNAASSLKPIQVVEAIREFYMYEYSNIYRGVYTLSQKATERYEDAREKVRKFINAESFEEVIFTYGATDSINMVAYSYGLSNLREGDEILLTVMEHHSNILPWINIASMTGAKVKFADITSDGDLDYRELESEITEKTKIVAVTGMSNVLGTIVDVKSIARKVHEMGGVILVDGAQSVPHMPTNVKDLEIDFLAFSGHKMLGPTGIGVLWVRKDLLKELKPFRYGGGAVREVDTERVEYLEPPHKFEAGTPNIVGAIGLGVAIEYLEKVGLENVRKHEEEITKYTLKRFEEVEDMIEVYGPLDTSKRGGIISFNLKNLDSNLVGTLLDSYGIAVRTGKHCAHILHKKINQEGTVRVSYYLYNTFEEIDKFISALHEIVDIT
ncbi:MAG: cysteine desulfurase [Nitrososphaerota archaeon]